jgi:hypothetical protein
MQRNGLPGIKGISSVRDSVATRMHATNKSAPLSLRLTRLLHPAFLCALTLLIANDWLFKPLFHNALTGKLSDVAGVFAFAYFWSVAAGRRHTTIHVLVGIAFAIWKSPLSQPAIDAWNALGLMPIARVVDAGDLLALAVLPLSWWMTVKADKTKATTHAETTAARVSKFVIAGIALVAFTATSKQFDSVVMEADYVSAHTAKRIGEIAQRNDTDAISALGENLTLRFNPDDCDEAKAYFSAHVQGTQTVLRLRTVAGRCSNDAFKRDAVLSALDPAMAKHFAAGRVKRGMGALSEPVKLTTPAGQCPMETDKAPKKVKRVDDGDSTYPPKTRARKPPPNDPTPLNAPAASPETPSPSAARNSN